MIEITPSSPLFAQLFALLFAAFSFLLLLSLVCLIFGWLALLSGRFLLLFLLLLLVLDKVGSDIGDENLRHS
jgi:hypothetical protein